LRKINILFTLKTIFDLQWRNLKVEEHAMNFIIHQISSKSDTVYFAGLKQSPLVSMQNKCTLQIPSQRGEI